MREWGGKLGELGKLGKLGSGGLKDRRTPPKGGTPNHCQLPTATANCPCCGVDFLMRLC
jgi:hypothetical protein